MNCARIDCPGVTGECIVCGWGKPILNTGANPVPISPGMTFMTGGANGCVCPPGANLTCQSPFCPRGRDGSPIKIT